MNGFREIIASISHVPCGVIASCESERITSVGSDEYEAVWRLRYRINQRYGKIFPLDMINS